MGCLNIGPVGGKTRLGRVVPAIHRGRRRRANVSSPHYPARPRKIRIARFQPHNIGIVQFPHGPTQARPRHCRDRVDHQGRPRSQPICCRRLNPRAKNWRICISAREAADCDRACRVEAVILDNDDGARLAGITRPSGHGPDFVAPESSASTEIPSMNAWSSASVGLVATARDWRCASAANAGERVSGTQTWIGLSPCARSRARCDLTLSREDFGFAVDDMANSNRGYM